MANVFATGFKPIKQKDGADIIHRRDSGWATTAIFWGDACLLTGTGHVVVASAAVKFRTVFTGCSYIDADGNRRGGRYLPAASAHPTAFDAELASFVYTVDNFANTIFEGCYGGTSAYGTLTNLNMAVDWVAGTGNTFTGTSGHYLDGSTITAWITTKPWRTVDYPRRADNDLTLATSKVWIVPISGTLLQESPYGSTILPKA